MTITVTEYVRADGSVPWQKWFNTLDVMVASKVAVARARMELGNTPTSNDLAGLVSTKSIGGRAIVFIWRGTAMN